MSEQAISLAVDAPHTTLGVSGSDVASDNPATPNQLISFAIGDDQYGVDIIAVREIKGWTAITPLPGQPEYVAASSIFAA
jgi:purine-binding chemotaxis protein CheW